MNSNEAVDKFEPHNKKEKYNIYKKNKFRISNNSKFFLCVVLLLTLSNIATYLLYRNIKSMYGDNNNILGVINQQSGTMIQENSILTDENSSLKKSVEKLMKENEKVMLEINEIKKFNEELISKNVELADDNIELQNSLKKAAAAGIKPQNYTEFDGLTSRGYIDRGSYLGSFMGTAYTPSKEECGNNKGITNSGEPIIPGISIAVDKNYWPFGTVFYIKGLGYAVAMDTGDAIKGRNRFDFAVFDREFANILGAKYWEVYLVKMGDGNVDEIAF